MRVVLLNYTGKRDNWGCQATSRSLFDFLQEEVFTAPAASVETVDYPANHWLDDDIDILYGARLLKIFSASVPSRPDLIFLERLARERFAGQFDVARAADVIVFQGEGSIGPSYQYRSVRLFALPFLAKHLWRKPVLAVNQTLYANSPADATILNSLMSAFDLVSVREAMSLQFARANGLPGTILCPDMAFRDSSLPVPGSTLPAGLPQAFFCVTGSAAVKQYSLDSYAGLVRSIAGRHGLTPVLLASTRKDSEFAQRLIARLDGIACHTVSAADMPDVRSVYPVLAAAAFVMGGRYHSIVSALSMGTPAVVLPSNTYKCEGLSPMLGLDIPVHDLSAPDAILATVSKTLQNRAAISDALLRKRLEFAAVYAAFAHLLQERAAGRPGHWTFQAGSASEPIAIAAANQRIYAAHNQDEAPADTAIVRLRHRTRLALARRLGILRRSLARDMG